MGRQRPLIIQGMTPGVCDIAIDIEALGEAVDPAALFGNDRPTELEIGCGKGGFLLRAARAHPERNFLAIEWANKYYKYAVDRMRRWGIENVRITRTDARHFVVHRLPDACLSAVHVYHPDPWPKKRHHKRRLFQKDFAEGVVRVLIPGGRLSVQTDHAAYFEQVSEVLKARAEMVEAPFEADDSAGESNAPETNFEIKYRRQGRSIYRLAFVRQS